MLVDRNKSCEIKDYESKRNICIIDLKRNQIVERKLRKELEKHEEVKSIRVRQDKSRRKDNIGIACLTTKKQAKLDIKMLNKTNHSVAN